MSGGKGIPSREVQEFLPGSFVLGRSGCISRWR